MTTLALDPTKHEKIIYWVSTALVLFAMSWSVIMYHLTIEGVPNFFEVYGYPGYVKYPLAYLKLIAILVIVSNRFNNLKEMVYAAYFINLVMATAGHLIGGDGVPGHHPWHAYILLIALPFSYIYSNRVRGKPQRNFLDFLTDPK